MEGPPDLDGSSIPRSPTARKTTILPFSEAFIRSLRRGSAPLAILTLLVGPLYAVATYADALANGSDRRSVLKFGFIPLIGIFYATLGIQMSIMAINRPRWCVPPHLRGEPGYFQLRRIARGPGRSDLTERASTSVTNRDAHHEEERENIMGDAQGSASSERGRILLLRPRGVYRDLLRRYSVRIDGELCAKLRPGAQAVIEVPAGEHTVTAHIDWAGSSPCTVLVSANELVVLQVRPSGGAFETRTQALTDPGRYLELVRM